MIAFRTKDGRGCVWNGPLAELQTKEWVDRIFGEISGLRVGEQINPDTGAIEPVPPSPEQQASDARRAQIKAILATLDARTATAAQVQGVLAALIRHLV